MITNLCFVMASRRRELRLHIENVEENTKDEMKIELFNSYDVSKLLFIRANVRTVMAYLHRIFCAVQPEPRLIE